MAVRVRYAKGPVTYLYDRDTRTKKRKQVLWGDWLRIGDDIDADWSEITWGKSKYAIRKLDYQEERILEMIFLDVGQGDGCILTTPTTGNQERILIVDAGIGKNTAGYLDYRFRDFKQAYTFHAAVITHPDTDHYRGFQQIFDNEQISFEHVYHNGLMERTGDDLLGPVEDGFLTDFKATKTAARTLYSDPDVRGGKFYPKLIKTALDSDRFDDVSMLSTDHGAKENDRTWMPGFAPSDQLGFTIEVLGPVVERAPNGRKGLRTFAKTLTGTAMNDGKTKNGHSVLLRLEYRQFSVLFGGDLNLPAEHFLMRHYGNGGKTPESLAETEAMIEAAGRRFGVDLMKCCHHGASDVTDEFLRATSPAAFVVSSGDEESHVHPRPDLLGLLGKQGRGHRPLVLCTELLRSTRESEDPALRRKLDRLKRDIGTAEAAVRAAVQAGDAAAEQAAEQERDELEDERDDVLDEVFKRNVGVYGAINVRTDGNTAVVAFRNEKGSDTKRWFTYELVPNDDGILHVAE